MHVNISDVISGNSKEMNSILNVFTTWDKKFIVEEMISRFGSISDLHIRFARKNKVIISSFNGSLEIYLDVPTFNFVK